jgi:uncharacterized protein YaeQ
VALTSTIYNFDIDLADADRCVYESLALRVARHPSESEDFLLTRVLAYALEFEPGVEFSSGLWHPDEPALWIRDPTAALSAWIEVGAPDAARLHKAAKASPRVVVYNHKDVTQWLGRLEGERIHRAAEIEVWAMDRGLLRELCARLERRTAFALSVSDKELLVAVGDATLTGVLTRHSLG